MSPAGPRSERREATRRNLIEIARGLYAERGYAETPIGEILSRAGLARGGLYHHFAGKQELFAAVAQQVEDEVLAWISAASRISGGGPWVALRAACGLYLSAFTDPGVRRVLLQDAPSVLGPTASARIRDSFRAQLDHALEGDTGQAAALTPLLVGALDAAALEIGDPADTATWDRLNRALHFLLEGLRLVEQQGVVPSLPRRPEWEENPWQAWQTRASATQKSSGI